MPRETIGINQSWIDGSTLENRQVQVQWNGQHDKDVNIGIDISYSDSQADSIVNEDDGEKYERYAGQFMNLNQYELNKLIATLKRAGRATFGQNEWD